MRGIFRGRRAPGKTVRLVVTLLVSTLLLPEGANAASAQRVSKWEWENAPRLVSIGDVHGSFGKLIELLKAAELVDANLRWSGGETHLVMGGDLIDRGPSDRGVMDLVHRLQDEAGKAGGEVHVLLGNHEVLNLVRDLRYVNHESYRDVADEERPAERKKAWNGFRRTNSSRKSNVNELQAAFDTRYPPGYFARARAFLSGEFLKRNTIPAAERAELDPEDRRQRRAKL